MSIAALEKTAADDWGCITLAPGIFNAIWSRLTRGLIGVVAMRDLTFSGIAGVFWFAMATLSAPNGSASAATLVLKDGTVIHGEVKTLQDDVYTVETDSLGTLRVRKQNVRTIDHGGEHTLGSPASGSSPKQPELEAMQLHILQSPDLLSMIQSLQNDPEVRAILADPEIMSALASGNYAALMNNPRIIALTNNSKVREVIDEVH